jgi:hypothetical protein
MPLYLDIHKKVEGATADAVAGAHIKDLEFQGRYGWPGCRRDSRGFGIPMKIISMGEAKTGLPMLI